MDVKYGKENPENTEEILARLDAVARQIKLSDIDNESSMVYKVMFSFSEEGVRSPMKYILAFPDPSKTYDTPEKILVNSFWTTTELYTKYTLEKDNSTTLQELSDNYGMPLMDILPIYYKYQRRLGKSETDIVESVNKYLEKPLTKEDIVKSLEYYEYSTQVTFEEDMMKYRTIVKLQEELKRFEPAKSTSIVFDDSRLRVDVISVMDEKKTDETYGLEIFDKSMVDRDVRYIQYNEGGQIIFDDRYINTPDSKRAFTTSQKKIDPSRIYYKIFTGVFDPNYYVGKLISNTLYIRGPEINAQLKLDRKPMSLIYDSKIGDEKKTRKIIEEHIPIKLGTENEIKVSGSFYVFDTFLEYSSFPFMLTIDAIAQNYLYLEERDTVLVDRSKINFHYKSLIGMSMEEEGFQYIKASVSVNFDQLHSTEDMVVKHGGESFKINKDTDYIRVNISKAKSRSVALQFQSIFLRLITRYNQLRQLYENYYKTFISDWEEESLVKQRVGGLYKENRTNLDTLIDALPDVFVAGYATACQADKQPVIVAPNQVDVWKSKGRELLEYPTDNPRVILGCPKDDLSFPYLQKNKLENNSEYPFIPCCRKGRKRSSTTSTSTGKKGESDYVVASQRALTNGTKGNLPETIKNIISVYREDSDLLRIGMPESPSSLLHCVAYALKSSEYMNLKDDFQAKERLIESYRKSMADSINPSLLKQELYDEDEETIMKNFRDNKVFLNPLLYYRAIEETLNINLFILSFGDDSRGKKEKKELSFGNLLIPRHKLFHIHSYIPERKNIIIFLHSGVRRAALTTPKCELVYDDSDDTRIFDSKMGDILNKMMNFINYNVTWISTQYDKHYVNYYSKQRIPDVKKQIIDKYGKARGFWVEKNNIWLFTDPMYPLNIASVSVDELKHLPTINDVIKNYGEPKFLDRQGSPNRIVGLIYDSTYIPIVPVTLDSPLPQGQFNPLFAHGLSVIGELDKVRRDANIMLSVIKYIRYQLRDIPFNDFIKKLEIINNHRYDFSKVPRHYPVNWKEYEIIVPSLVTTRGTIVMDSKKLYDKIVYQIKRFDIETEGLRLNPLVIRGYYSSENDFKEGKETIVLIGETKKNIWVKERTETFNNRIYTEIDESFSKNRLPYIYEEGGKYFIIQNVLNGDLARAIQVANYWKYDQYNSGYFTTLPSDISKIDHNVFIISVTKKIQAAIVSVNPNAHKILKYGNNNFAAILELP